MNKRKSKARLFLLIPMVTHVIIAVSFGLIILKIPADIEIISLVCIAIAVLGPPLTPIPNTIFSISGIISAIRAKREGATNIVLYVVVGILGIIISVLLTWFWIHHIFIPGLSI